MFTRLCVLHEPHSTLITGVCAGVCAGPHSLNLSPHLHPSLMYVPAAEVQHILAPMSLDQAPMSLDQAPMSLDQTPMSLDQAPFETSSFLIPAPHTPACAGPLPCCLIRHHLRGGRGPGCDGGAPPTLRAIKTAAAQAHPTHWRPRQCCGRSTCSAAGRGRAPVRQLLPAPRAVAPEAAGRQRARALKDAAAANGRPGGGVQRAGACSKQG